MTWYDSKLPTEQAPQKVPLEDSHFHVEYLFGNDRGPRFRSVSREVHLSRQLQEKFRLLAGEGYLHLRGHSAWFSLTVHNYSEPPNLETSQKGQLEKLDITTRPSTETPEIRIRLHVAVPYVTYEDLQSGCTDELFTHRQDYDHLMECVQCVVHEMNQALVIPTGFFDAHVVFEPLDTNGSLRQNTIEEEAWKLSSFLTNYDGERVFKDVKTWSPNRKRVGLIFWSDINHIIV